MTVKLFQVRKGQLVYYQNELHRVYSVKPVYKQSIHLVRLRDLEQRLCEAGDIERYKPQSLDSFVFDHNRYTLHRDQKAEKGDYILITKPSPEYMDYYFLNEIEKVAIVEKNGVVTNRSNGIKHREYMVMVPGREEGSTPIDYQDSRETKEPEDPDVDSSQSSKDNAGAVQDPGIGDVYKKNNSGTSIEAMVVAVQSETIILGGNLQVSKEELMDTEKWTFLYSLLET
ncbi:MAG TPA: hypothetical protein VFT51_07715 [Bacillales bacterium]|nr:hypothetical protein [Bacillales bacterium]